MSHPSVLAVALLLLAGCRSAPWPPSVSTWGTMREVLREGHSEGRVRLGGLGARGAIGVGALAGLAGEVTIVDGRVLVARAEGAACRVEEAAGDEEAALLVTAEVGRWRQVALPDVADYDALDAAIGAAVEAGGLDRTAPTPVRVVGRAVRLEYHVIAGACPIARPDGPPPWRFAGAVERVTLVGIYVEGAAGRLTHHVHRSHLHVVAPGRMGHLDDVQLSGAVLLLPAAP